MLGLYALEMKMNKGSKFSGKQMETSLNQCYCRSTSTISWDRKGSYVLFNIIVFGTIVIFDWFKLCELSEKKFRTSQWCAHRF